MNDFVTKWRFAAQRRWFTYLGMAIVFAIACVLLSPAGSSDATSRPSPRTPW